jgi:hypothetical protein
MQVADHNVPLGLSAIFQGDHCATLLPTSTNPPKIPRIERGSRDKSDPTLIARRTYDVDRARMDTSLVYDSDSRARIGARKMGTGMGTGTGVT